MDDKILQTYTEFYKKQSEATAAKKLLNSGIDVNTIGPSIPSNTGTGSSQVAGALPQQNFNSNDVASVFSKGISPEKANSLFEGDIATSERAVKAMLIANKVETVPQNVFDGLVSFHNQTGDASYAFVRGEKIDLTQMYRNGEWARAASFIAADERDRPRRQKEAAMIANNNYGPQVNTDALISQGMEKTNELILKGKLNQQTGTAATAQQMLAASSVYQAQTGKTIPGTSFDFNNVSKYNPLEQALKKRSGPFPY